MCSRTLSSVLFAMVLLACNKPQKAAERTYIDVPGWACAWDEGYCKCVRADAPSVPANATHPNCNAPQYTNTCVGSWGMHREPQLCSCMTESRSFKKGDGDEDVPQCPPPPRAK